VLSGGIELLALRLGLEEGFLEARGNAIPYFNVIAEIPHEVIVLL